MKYTEIRLASTNHESVIADVVKLFPDWNESRQTLLLDSGYNILPFVEGVQAGESPSGYRIDICPIRDRIIEHAEYDEDDNLIKAPVYAGEKRVDIIAPGGFALPEFDTQVFPTNPDSRYSI